MEALDFARNPSTEDEVDVMPEVMADPDVLKNAPTRDLQANPTGMGSTTGPMAREGGQDQAMESSDRPSGETVGTEPQQDAGMADDPPDGTCPAWRDGYASAAGTGLTAERLTGAAVFSSVENWVG